MPRRIKKRQYQGAAAGKWLLPDWEWLFTGLTIHHYEAPNPFLYFGHNFVLKHLTPLWKDQKEKILRFWHDPESEPDFPFADEILLINGIGAPFDRPHIFWELETDGRPILKRDRAEILQELGQLTDKEKELIKSIKENEY